MTDFDKYTQSTKIELKMTLPTFKDSKTVDNEADIFSIKLAKYFIEASLPENLRSLNISF